MVELVETRRVRLGEVADFINGAAFKPEDWGPTGARIIRIQNLSDPSKAYNRTERIVPQKLHVRPGDLLVSWSASLGVFVWDQDDIALLNQHIFRVIPDDALVDKNYLRHMLSDALDSMKRHLHGATMMHVNRKEFLSTSIPLPPLDEQRRIAAILDKTDELRTKRREALAHLDMLTQSIFHSMFGGVLSRALLSDAIGRLVGGKNVVGPDDSPNAFRVLKISSVTSGQYLEAESKPLPEDYEPPSDHVVRDGDVIISRANTTELVGSSALAATTNGKSVLPDKLWRAVPTPRADSRFLLATLQSPAVRGEISRRSSGSGGSMKNISQPKLLSIPIALPPMELQQTFATRVAAVERLKELHRKHLAELDALFASLQHRAFRGEL
ncbi:restriction endonuclease subunit S [Arthrobacter echini]|uniref:Restriction endonuclease subunit S n=1 Tax=Arthrobacter echini TaxID=1529066 RepID=A0A4S5E4Z0_9MICC|nr:restriction endonuclease subunit S [Arthrobacter echini]THJ66483.1 restriction endonuclease subunit S [Arthrobacter echini]